VIHVYIVYTRASISKCVDFIKKRNIEFIQGSLESPGNQNSPGKVKNCFTHDDKGRLIIFKKLLGLCQHFFIFL